MQLKGFPKFGPVAFQYPVSCSLMVVKGKGKKERGKGKGKRKRKRDQKRKRDGKRVLFKTY